MSVSERGGGLGRASVRPSLCLSHVVVCEAVRARQCHALRHCEAAVLPEGDELVSADLRRVGVGREGQRDK